MKAVWVLAVAVACKKDGATPVRTVGSGSASHATPVTVVAGDAAVVAADAAGPSPGLVDLLHAVHSTVRVSSQVRNKKILPKHIVDGDLQTAWNSRTGELVGAWIDIACDDAHVAEVRMTVGHTGRGPKHEDYFTMNPRIAKLRVVVDGKPEQVVTLDPDKRELQVVPVDADKHVRLVVAEIKPGTKKSWREAAVSELQVWGTPPAGWTKPPSPLAPLVLVGEEVPGEDPNDPCANMEQERAAREASVNADADACSRIEDPEERAHCGVDEPGMPRCDRDVVPIDKIALPWVGAVETCETQDDIYGPKVCTLVVKTKTASTLAIELESEFASDSMNLEEAVVADVLPGAPAELVFRYKLAGDDKTEQLVVCRAAPELACSTPIALAGDDWQADVTFKNGKAVLFAKSGKPPDDALGEKLLVFP